MLSQHEQLRYSRQIMLKKIGENGQLALRDAKVLIVGMGGLGNPVSLYLAAAGVGTLFIADGDNVDITNLQRQILFTESDVGTNKADIGAEKLQQHNSDITVEVIDEMLDTELAHYYIEQVDVVIDCTDNIATRYLLNQVCVDKKTPLIVGAATGFDGQQLVVDPRDPESACYQCLFPASEKAPTNNCQTVGIVGPVLAIVAGMQSLQAIKLLTGNAIHINQLNMFDGLSNQWQQFSLKKQPDCPVCGDC
ncbi:MULTISPECIES: HesA/MoeB/ThiF family protein [unclassified Colwellia]|jgi:sulfur carrier protein ThiS adenylyltransferase|uniref:HesA/MoeB/ThiF family protein n=1 Tax=unclassified Colwellia TaxID=196834 RepID=UPI0015F36E58|nr:MULTISPECIES: HesA/MoeB/ThiF family protein [unclassified Colwellia]MBA6233190.1 HesA/MoeB/ThiF family protein [Colwellia sp. MB02u-7]MBA6236280.1 HesA/MoeB/ThiF family protein [Colwellia sp. MB02u-11]MBA6256819.1 HesA/MoeB/ThiF family protein [Colwellia sp. MB3u-28]MBA6261175.1 HesA/MoeB/ThiF family protein [Colwellia sp. MB3u-41]MBA6264101.1 HesA/MoeB/ThiF family protein [Colwellia sp. Bg11-12]